MGITTSYNKRTGLRYAYDTTYEMDEAAGRKVQRRRCIGHVDPQTGEIVPNGRRGRPRVAEPEAAGTGSVPTAAVAAGPSGDRLAGVEAACAALARSCDDLADVARSLEREVRLLRES